MKKVSTNRNIVGGVYLAASALCFSIMWVFVKELKSAIPSIQLVFIRETAIAFCCLFFLLRRNKTPFKTRSLPLHALRGLLRAGGSFFGFYAVANMPTAEATTIIFSQPIFMIPFAFLLLKEKVNTKTLIATLIGFVGVLILIQPGTKLFNPVAFFALAAAIISIFPNIIVKLLPKEDGAMKILFYSEFFSSICLAMPAFMVWQPLSMPVIETLFLICVLGFIAQYLIIAGYKIGDATSITPIQYIQLPFNALFGYMVFAEDLTFTTILGASLIVSTATYIATRKKI